MEYFNLDDEKLLENYVNNVFKNTKTLLSSQGKFSTEDYESMEIQGNLKLEILRRMKND